MVQPARQRAKCDDSTVRQTRPGNANEVTWTREGYRSEWILRNSWAGAGMCRALKCEAGSWWGGFLELQKIRPKT